MGLAALVSLTDELIAAVVKFPADQKESTRVLNLKRRVQGSLRPSGHSLTDQFAVARQLEGLQEKFQVVNRDELAEALRERLVELEGYRSSWTPEILSLLLQLSDRPATLSKLDNLSKPIQVPEEESLSLYEKGLGGAFGEEDIWEQVDFTADSSDDELASLSSEESRPRAPPRTPSFSEQDYVIPDEIFVSGEDKELIATIEKVQFWRPENYHHVTQRDQNPSRVITELQLARETIFMLQGLPTSIFWRLDDDVEMDHSYILAHSSRKALSSLLHSFTEIGAKIDAVRRFTHIPQTIPYMQTFSRCLEERLLEFDSLLSQTQCRYLSPGSTVSLLQLLDDVRLRSHHLLVLADLITRLKQDHIQPMRCLDLLYDSVCMQEAVGDENATKRLSALFFSCFKTYTRSIQLWMETGQVDPLDTAFFVRVNRENRDLRNLWHDWHVLDEGLNRQNIPQFLEPAVNRVFTTGKSMVFLRHLNALPERPESFETPETLFDHHKFSEPSLISLPFSALVESTFDKLVDANHSISAGILRAELDEQCGLWSSLDALEHVYLGKDLSILGTIDTKIFELMDRSRAWDDKFLLTEVTRTAFSVMPEIDLSRLIVRSDGSSHHDQNRSVHILESVSIDYVLPWPIANIITQDAIQSYQSIARFLMQIRRAKYALVRQRVRDARVPTDESAQTLVHGLHHHLLWFLDILYSHLTYFVISTANQSLRSTLSNTEDVDAMIAAHQSYMSSLESQCLLSENLAPIHELIITLLDLCIHFADLQAVHAHAIAASEDGMSDSRFIPSKSRRNGIDNSFDSDSDEDEDDGLDHEQTMTISFRESPYELQMQNLKLQFDHLVGFVADGLKGIARADGLPSWNILAERLEWRKRLA
ncbi:uncharacterized protein N7484_003032 [Penicillium longicatenatum]|uniref:uncharacterized protein n=1 Tax=Penicillium longicatenatum TaxID=1561947 RepID=UPI002548B327|nr:uncharacterized protein N7484_003032 [Penicillium longicatenatum]KAJ5649309.1 hypothetical protein N7484_003032 [Penicillium longicatenatum]